MIIGFDFDGCLGDLSAVQNMCDAYIRAGVEVHIITYRWPDQSDNWRVLATAAEIGIPEANVHYCGGLDKVVVANELGVDVYYDDSSAEVHRFNTAGHVGARCLGVCVGYTMNVDD